MKKLLLLSLVILAVVVGCKKNDAPENQTLTLNQTKVTLQSSSAALTVQLSVAEPTQYAGSASIKWSSENTAVATVDSKGLVTAVAPGYAIITAFVDGQYNIKGACEVTVLAANAKLEFTVANTLNVGDTVFGTYAYTPTTPIGSDVALFKSDTVGTKFIDLSVWMKKQVDENGDKFETQTDSIRVIALAPGKVRVVVSNVEAAKYGYKIADTVELTVTNIAVESFAFNAPFSTLEAGKSATLKVDILPTAAKNSPVKWRSSDPLVATVSASGKVTGVNVGTAVISASTAFNQVLMQTVTVTKAILPDAAAFAFDKKEAVLVIDGYPVKLTLTLSPTMSNQPTLKLVPTSELEEATQIILSGNTISATSALSTTGNAAVVAFATVDGVLVTDTCFVTVNDVADNSLLAKPVYQTINNGKNTVVTAKMVNFMSAVVTLDKVELTRMDGEKKVRIEAINVGSTYAQGKVAQVAFATLLTNTAQIKTYAVTYTYTVNGLTSIIERAVVLDNGTAFAPGK